MTKVPRRSHPREDEKPWHRQFWPWFLIALPGTVVIASLTTLYIANRYSDDLVVDEYYKDGLAINVELGKARRAEERGIDAQLQILERTVQVRLGGDEYGDELQLRLSHPLEADRDFSMVLQRQAPGLYGGQMPATVAANWHWTLGAIAQAGTETDDGSTATEEGWRLDGSLTAQNFLD
jgi:hypothetical protein